MPAGPSPDAVPSLSRAILRTLLYADVFGVPLTVDEIRRYLERIPASRDDILRALRQDQWLRSRVTWDPPFVALSGCDEALSRRRSRERASERLMPKAKKFARWLASAPFVRMVALTGALGVGNLRDGDDDIDYLIVTAPGRLWMARFVAVMLVHAARLDGVTLCPNYLMASDALAQQEHTLFTARELAQMVPLYGTGVYNSLLTENEWAQALLPNGFDEDGAPSEDTLPVWISWGKRVAERLMSGRVGDVIERAEMQRKVRRLCAAASEAHTQSARFSEQICKGHLGDYGVHIREAYVERLERAGLTPGMEIS